MAYSKITIDTIEQNVMKGRYYTPANEQGVRQLIHPETNVNNVIDETGKTLKVILSEQSTQSTEYTDSKIAELVGSAPETLDTIHEIAAAIKANDDIIQVLNESIATKASTQYVDNQLALKASLEDVYTKTDADNLLSAKANVGDVYTKTRVNELLAEKLDAEDLTTALESVVSNDEFDTYKTETDGKIATVETSVSTLTAEVEKKANSTDVNTALSKKANAADVYTKAQTDTAIGAVPHVKVGTVSVDEAEDVRENDLYIQLI